MFRFFGMLQRRNGKTRLVSWRLGAEWCRVVPGRAREAPGGDRVMPSDAEWCRVVPGRRPGGARVVPSGPAGAREAPCR